MVGAQYGWLRFWSQVGMGGTLVAALVTGCASPQAPSGDLAGQAEQTLGDVSVMRDGEGSVVSLGGLEAPAYSLTEREDENLVVVDLVGVAQGEATSLAETTNGATRQIAAYDGVVDMVTLSTFEDESGATTTRVEIQLAERGQATVDSVDGALEISIMPGANDQALMDEALSDAASADTLPSESWNAESEPIATAVAETARVIAAPKPATQLLGLSARAVEGGVLVGLEANGTLDAVEVFTLENPARLVLDLPGIAAAASAKNVKLDSQVATGVRLGAHEGKLRVVVDGGSAAGGFAARQVMPGASGLFLAVGEGEALAQAMNDAVSAMEASYVAQAASQPATPVEASQSSTPAEANALAAAGSADPTSEAAPSTAPSDATTTTEPSAAAPAAGQTEVYGLSFERLDSMDRTAILADREIQFTTYSPDATTLVVRIAGARISEEASDRLFPEQGGPVSMIHAFQQPDVKTPEVRVVFTRAENQKPVFSTHANTLFVDFEDLGVAAAAPPAFSEPASAAASDLAADSSPAASESEVVSSQPDSVPASAATAELPSKEALEASPNLTPAVMEEAEALFADESPAAASAAAPAAVEVPAAIEVLEEGGLIDGKEYRGRRVSLDFKDVAIADVLRLIAEVSDLNIIAGDEVSGNVTIRLVEVPWDQALDVILMTKGLGFVRVGNVLRIAPADVLKAEEEVRLQERRNKEKLEDLEVKLLPINYAKVKDIETLVRRLLSARGTVNLDERTNTLIIKDISSVIDEASALIAAIDTQTPQVMIEAKIVEANLDFSRELGSVWGVQTQRFVDPFDPDTQRTDLGNEDLTFIDQNSLVFANPITASPTGLLTLGALILDQDFRVDAQIQAAEAAGDGKVISSPRIVTLDNKQATIEQGVSIPFQTFEGGDAKLEFIDAVLSLVVTPHITADQSVTMQIEVTRNAPDSTVPTPTGSPAIAKNVAETQTLVKDGQTLVLGGIYTVTKSQRQTRVPYLHRIPVIGNVFKSTETTDQRKELLVFVTPRIVRLPEMAAN